MLDNDLAIVMIKLRIIKSIHPLPSTDLIFAVSFSPVVSSKLFAAVSPKLDNSMLLCSIDSLSLESENSTRFILESVLLLILSSLNFSLSEPILELSSVLTDTLELDALAPSSAVVMAVSKEHIKGHFTLIVQRLDLLYQV